MKRFICPLIVSLICITTAFGQPSGPMGPYEKALELIHAGKYSAAYGELNRAEALLEKHQQVVQQSIDFYKMVCIAELQEAGAERFVESYIAANRNPVYANQALMVLGNIRFRNGDYADAIRLYRSIDPDHLSGSQLQRYHFNLGYALFTDGQYHEAYPYLKQVQWNSSTERETVAYALAYMDYLNGDYDTALAGFNALRNAPQYGGIVPYYILQVQFLQGKYTEVTAQGDRLLAESDTDRRADIYRIIGESYYQLGDYERSLSFLKNYERSARRLSSEELYMLGYSSYITRNYNDAIDYLNRIDDASDRELTQNAYYHLGDAYLQKFDRYRAMLAFGMAAGIDGNPLIGEDAMYNYAKLQFDLETSEGSVGFSQSAGALNRFLSTYPGSDHVQEIREYLAIAYLNGKNYDAALEAISQVKNPDGQLRAALQKVTYLKGTEYFIAGDYRNASRMLDTSLANPIDPKYTALAKYWKGETLYRQENYTAATPFFKEYLAVAPRTEKEYRLAHYNLGYAYFNTKNWNESRNWFDRLLGLSPENEMQADAYNRLGDIDFIGRNYAAAGENYRRSADLMKDRNDYAVLQYALTQGLTGDTNGKIRTLQTLADNPRSDYADRASFELGRTYVQNDRFAEGATVLKKLTDERPGSPYYVSALAELGLVYHNMGNSEQALRYYKTVVERYPQSPEAKDAMLGIRNIYVERNEVESYFAFAQANNMNSDLSAQEKGTLLFNSAEGLYMAGDYSRAVTSLENYLKQYPSGSHVPDATFYLADCRLREGRNQLALEGFEKVAAMSPNPFSVPSLQNAAAMNLEKGDYAKAHQWYERLESISTQPSVTAEAQHGMLQAAMSWGNAQQTINAADKLLANDNASADALQQARYAKAAELAAAGNRTEALELFRKAAEQPKTRYGAESRYRTIQLLYEDQKYGDAEKAVFAFSESGTPYQSWLAKSFIILGDIYARRGDNFQARATYQSIIDGYRTTDDGILEEATRKRDALQN